MLNVFSYTTQDFFLFVMFRGASCRSSERPWLISVTPFAFPTLAKIWKVTKQVLLKSFAVAILFIPYPGFHLHPFPYMHFRNSRCVDLPRGRTQQAGRTFSLFSSSSSAVLRLAGGSPPCQHQASLCLSLVFFYYHLSQGRMVFWESQASSLYRKEHKW